MKTEKKNVKLIIFIITFILIIAVGITGIINTYQFNKVVHQKTLKGASLFSEEGADEEEVSIRAIARSSTWSKAFDLENSGVEDHTHQAFTYDFPVINNTNDEVAKFSFKLTFANEVFLLSAWNGALEIHQNIAGSEYVETIPDLREFKPWLYSFDTFSADGDTMVRMNPGDYLIYHPNSTEAAMEVPIKPHEGTNPGIILYTAIGEDIEGSSIYLEYQFHREWKNDTIFRISLAALVLWLIAFAIFAITSAKIKKYKVLHERDNVIIEESIETFTGFIDAKDPYTNGHSKRVAQYTRLIAEKMGYEGEELDRIYYIALLHDCGKIGVPDNILGKPEKLTDEEFEIIKSHTVHGGDILSSFKSLENAGEGALYHHERYDGKGYPEGRAGEDIPLIARMICVADSFDAMNSNRCYRKKLTREKIISEIENNKGKQFDPKIADVFLKLIKEYKVIISD